MKTSTRLSLLPRGGTIAMKELSLTHLVIKNGLQRKSLLRNNSRLEHEFLTKKL
jgi:hypothetical protein